MKLPAVSLAVLSIGACLAAAPARAQIESREGIALQNQILELRQQLSQLQQFQTQVAPSQGALPPPEPEGAPPQMQGASSDVVAQLVVRVSSLEEQMRALQGRVAELENAEHRDHDDLAKQIGDLAFKLGQGGSPPPGAGLGGAPDPGTVPSTSSAAGGMDLTSAAPPPPPPAPAHRAPELALKQGNAALARRDYAGAEAAAREVLALGHSPRTADATFLLARAQAGQHEYKDAAATYYGVYKASPKSPRAAEALLGVSNALIGLNDTAPACQALAKLAAEFPHPDASVRAGMVSARKRASCH
jgi:TolA-binding protein